MSTLRNTKVSAKRIAVVRTDRLGDMVLTLPMCAALRQEIPDAEITLITRTYVAPLLYQSPVIDRIIYADTPKEVSAAIRNTEIDMIFFPRPQFSEYLAAFRAPQVAVRSDDHCASPRLGLEAPESSMVPRGRRMAQATARSM